MAFLLSFNRCRQMLTTTQGCKEVGGGEGGYNEESSQKYIQTALVLRSNR